MLSDLGSRTGTRLYMAPELSAGKPASIASDIFALGVLLYQMVSGDLTRPLAQGWEREIPDPLLVEDIAACIDGNPNERIASGHLVAERLRSLDARREQRAEEEIRVAAEARRARRLRGATIAAVVLLVIAIGGFVVAGVIDQKRREADDARREAEDARGKLATALAQTQAERDAKTTALDEVLRLADSKKALDLILEMRILWPVHPDGAPRMAAWLKRTKDLLAKRPGHQKLLAAVRLRADPYSEEQRRKDYAEPFLYLDRLRAELAKLKKAPDDTTQRVIWNKQRAELSNEIENLEGTVRERGSWSFPTAEDAWRHQVLANLVVGLDRLEKSLDDIEKRHERARTLRQRTLAVDWKPTTEAVAASDKYGGLRIEPQLGLVPLGKDPGSALFEFAQLDSGTIPKRDPTTNQLILADDFALVLVLIPGGTFRMGAQRTNPKAPNYDPLASEDEAPVHEVTLSPYFISKYECTQAQWASFTGKRPSRNAPGNELQVGSHVTVRHPVEQVSWVDCIEWLPRHNLALPSEAQWQFACRAGTNTPFFTGRDAKSLRGFANLADAYLKASGGPESWSYEEELNDGYASHAPVGSFKPNALGLHDTHGNVWEWCHDTIRLYLPVAQTDPVVRGLGNKMSHGGSWGSAGRDSRSSFRSTANPDDRDDSAGFRAARPITVLSDD